MQIGEVTTGDQLHFYMNDQLVADVNADSLVLGGGAPVYDREFREPAYLQQISNFNIDSIAEPTDLKAIASQLVALPNIASKNGSMSNTIQWLEWAILPPIHLPMQPSSESAAPGKRLH